MTSEKWRGVAWGLVGILAGAYALQGATSWAYRIIPSEPATLSLGLVLSVISLIGIVRTFRRQTGWRIVWLVVAFWVALLGAVMDGLLLWFGRTVTGFY
ncbi:MAG TPA: hypothetical protein H9875_04220 [Candidatus Levilactobacillus faecigallinarum]|uniref:Uncharacterized protein n=1 Tax=Candidatus Levilactobacillus faecigallinarum TaxID=2838638 RepID=A0A9D1QS60_9LACO|nr:hypothetical protein [Candidatus Levilactobacillus faecigallinarum]